MAKDPSGLKLSVVQTQALITAWASPNWAAGDAPRVSA